MSDDGPGPDERETVAHDERASLNEQVKLLVRTEQRLHRSQNALDRQLVRVELLSQFALRWDSGSSQTQILTDSVRLFKRLFSVERAVAVQSECHDEREAEHTAPVKRSASAVLSQPADVIVDALGEAAAPLVVPPASLTPRLRELLEQVKVVDPADSAKAMVVVVPLYAGTTAPIGIIAATCVDVTRNSAMRDAPSQTALPFITLVASHVEHMLKNTRLLDDLARTQRQLLQARNELEERVEIRTRELTREIAERRRAEEELIVARDAAESASRAKSAFVANMSHELRTPLNAIIGYSELIRESAQDADPEIVADIDRILISSRHLLRMINDVLDLSKIGAGRMMLEHQPFNISTLLSDVVTTATQLAAKKNNRIAADIDPELGSMVGDSTRVTQILLNLLGNSAKFTENGVIRLGARRQQYGERDACVFTIEDSGIGMNADELARAFGEFTQADSSTTRKYGGSGLGLTISQTLVRLMGGRIEATSEPGVGSVFMVTLPMDMDESKEDDADLDAA